MNNNPIVINQESYAKMNLSNKLFKDLDFTKMPAPVSFYRSDFRGSKFQSVTFCKNDFDLADFISNIWINVELSKVNFGNCSFKNGYFSKCRFTNNIYGDASYQDCTFVKCTFQDEVFKMTMLDCSFEDCQFINCVFDQCTTGSLSFHKCTIIKCEMSTMSAEDYEISECTIRDTYLGACFLGTYLMKNVNLNLLGFKYRGDLINIDDEYFQSFAKELLEQKRYFEYFNLFIILYAPIKNPILPLIHCLEGIKTEENPNVQAYNLKGIFKAIDFYMGSDLLDYVTVLKMLAILNNFDSKQLNVQNHFLFQERLFSLQNHINQSNFNISYISNIQANIPCTITIHCNDTSFSHAEEEIMDIFDEINRKVLKERFQKPLFNVISTQQGSVIITIASSLLLALMAAHTIHAIHTSICRIRIEAATTNKEVQFIKNSSNPASLEETLKITENSINDDISTTSLNLYNKISKDYIIEYIIKYFLE